jgi:hypothetical protein
MSHCTRDDYHQRMRLHILENLLYQCAGEPVMPRACRVCYVVEDGAQDCYCHVPSWAPLRLVIIELRASLNANTSSVYAA